MSFASWFQSTNSRGNRIPVRRRRSIPRLEVLEDRLALATFTVINTLDAGLGSLRQAILDSNASVGVADTINFEIGAGTQTIMPATQLPTISDPVTIDGTAPVALPTQKIELKGAGAVGPADGLLITAGNSIVRGLVINRFGDDGIELRTGGGNRVEGCFLGIDVSGTAGLGNGNSGLEILSSADNVIGGTASGVGNVMSGNSVYGILINGAAAQRNQILGNRIGTNAAGTAVIANNAGVTIESLAGNTTIGGSDPAARNIISGNNTSGINLAGANAGNNGGGDVVIGNYIGTDVMGTIDLGNRGNGVFFGSNSRIGGTLPGEGNLLSGNDSAGIRGGGTRIAIQGNYIGTNATGAAALGNGQLTGGQGLRVEGAPGALVSGNLISGNNGVGLYIASSDGIRVEGNRIGTNAAGTGDLGNRSHGLFFPSVINNATIGGTGAETANIIAFNDGVGVFVAHQNAQGVGILRNSIYANDGLGIDLGATLNPTGPATGVTPNDLGDGDDGSNHLQNYPVLKTASTSGGSTTIVGTLSSKANTIFRIELFASLVTDPTDLGFGEGQTFLEFTLVTTDDDGNGGFNILLPEAVPAGQFITATATDPGNNTSEFSQSLIVTQTNQAPVADDDAYNVSEDGTLAPVAPGVLGNDTDADGNSLTAALVAGASHGSLTFSANGTFSYTPAANYFGPDSFTYQASDGAANSNVATVTIVVTSVNDAPVATDGNLGTAEDTEATGTLVASDIDSAALTYSLVDVSNAHGTVTITNASNGAYSYSPDANYNGPASFTFQANDGAADSNLATVTIMVTSVNDAPVAADGSLSTAEDSGATSTLVAGDIDSTALTYSVVDASNAHGTVTITNASTGAYSYSPNVNYSGPASFTFRANDGTANSNVATITILVTPVNDAPGADNDGPYNVVEGDTMNVFAASGVLIGDADVDSTTLTAILVGSPAHGLLTLHADGSFTYVHDGSETTSDSFTYKATDGAADSNVATVTITVTPVNDPPVITSNGGGATAVLSIPENTTSVTTLTAADPEGSAGLTFAISGGADASRFTIDANTGVLRFITAPDYEAPVDVGADNVYQVQVQVSDGALIDTQAINVTVTDVAEGGSPVTIGQGCCDATALVVQGTEGNDKVRILPQGCGGGVKVLFNGTEYSFAAGSFTSIVVYGAGGDDDIRVAGAIGKNACLHGGAGNDLLQGGSGDDILLGGEGSDALHGGQGRDLIIGGRGADRLVGNADDDILIAGTTDFDGNAAALCAIMAEWNRCDLAYVQRVTHLRHGGGLNGGVKLTEHTVHDDGAMDKLTGSDGRDWYFANLDCGIRDCITDDHANEFADDLD